MIDGMNKINIMGQYILAGAVFPIKEKSLDPETIIRKMITIKGIHNYRPEHLAKALKFLEKSKDKFPYHKIVKESFPLSDLNQAFSNAANEKNLRTAIIP